MVVVACDYSDRFGDEGTIGVAVIDLDRGNAAQSPGQLPAFWAAGSRTCF